MSQTDFLSMAKGAVSQRLNLVDVARQRAGRVPAACTAMSAFTKFRRQVPHASSPDEPAPHAARPEFTPDATVAESPRPRFAPGLAVAVPLLAILLLVPFPPFAAGAAGSWDLSQPHVPDRLIVVPRADLPPGALDQWCRTHGAEILRRHPGLGDLHVVRKPPGSRLDDILRRLESDRLVEFAEPDYLLRTTREPDDPDFLSGRTWSLHDRFPPNPAVRSDIRAPLAWDVRTDAGSIIVGVIDSGIRLTHEDLAANLWVNPAEIPGNGRDDDRNGYVDDIHGINSIDGTGDPTDTQGHGTHVAGIIGAVGNNGVGTAGVAWRVRLMALKFIGDDGQGATSDAVRCLDYARLQGARIVNASWGSSARSQSLRRAIDRARDAGMILVAAAGNESADLDRNPLYPAAFDAANIVAVASSTRTGDLAASSSYGLRSVDLAAPGELIHSTWSTSDASYRLSSGASMAAPHVAGTLALLAAECPSCSYSALIETLLDTVDPVPSLAGRVRSGGRLNAGRALERYRIASVQPPSLRIQGPEPGPAVVFELTGTPGGRYRIEASTDLPSWRLYERVTLGADGRHAWRIEASGADTDFLRARIDPD